MTNVENKTSVCWFTVHTINQSATCTKIQSKSNHRAQSGPYFHSSTLICRILRFALTRDTRLLHDQTYTSLRELARHALHSLTGSYVTS